MVGDKTHMSVSRARFLITRKKSIHNPTEPVRKKFKALMVENFSQTINSLHFQHLYLFPWRFKILQVFDYRTFEFTSEIYWAKTIKYLVWRFVCCKQKKYWYYPQHWLQKTTLITIIALQPIFNCYFNSRIISSEFFHFHQEILRSKCQTLWT